MSMPMFKTCAIAIARKLACTSVHTLAVAHLLNHVWKPCECSDNCTHACAWSGSCLPIWLKDVCAQVFFGSTMLVLKAFLAQFVTTRGLGERLLNDECFESQYWLNAAPLGLIVVRVSMQKASMTFGSRMFGSRPADTSPKHQCECCAVWVVMDTCMHNNMTTATTRHMYNN